MLDGESVVWALVLYGVGAASSGFNTWYFGGYRSPLLRRRVGAAAMAMMSLALFVDSLFGLLFLAQGLRSIPLESPHWLLARTLLAAGSLFITVLVVRQLVRRGRNG